MKTRDLIYDLEEMVYQLEQYRLLTNKLVNNNISQYNIDKFIEEEYIKTTDNNYFDYDYDLFNWLSINKLEEAIKILKDSDD